MKKATLILCALLAVIFLYGTAPKNNIEISEKGDLANAQQYMQKQQFAFEENKGQVTGADAPKVKYTYKAQGLSVFLLNDGIAYQFNKTHYPEGYKHLDKFAKREEQEQMEELAKNIRTETYRMDVQLVGANPNPQISTEGKSKDYIQYYNHNALDVHSYSKVTYHNVYPNIDWVIYAKGEQGLKYDFVVHPGGNPNQIKLQTNWVEDIKLNQDGSLTLQNRMGTISEQTPVSFQEGEKIKTSFQVENNTISFNLANFNPNQTLIIDPLVRLWGTYYGRSDDNWGRSCAVDGSGNVYLAGYTNSTTGIALGGHQDNYGGGNTDAFLVKFNSSGVRQWGTYYGGIGNEYSNDCTVDGSGNVYLSGTTFSSINISSGGYQNNFGGGGDAFLVKFNAAGVRQWATYYGGSNSEQGFSCAVDGSGNVYLVGRTESTTGISSSEGFQNTFGGGNYDAFLVKFNAIGTREWATYYGGSKDDLASSCEVDGFGNVYISGETQSTSAIAIGGFQNAYSGGGLYGDAFLVKFNTAGNRQWGTYYGGIDQDNGSSCAVDDFDNVYLTGFTESTTGIASGGHQNTLEGNSDAFLVKFNAAGVRQWATYYGGSDSEGTSDCQVDSYGNVYLYGGTTSTTGIASSGYQNIIGGDNDAYLVKFNAAGVRQWATYYGGNDFDAGLSCAADGSGNVYLAGVTSSLSGIAAGGHQNTIGGFQDAFLVKFNTIPDCVPSIAISASSSTICSGGSATFTATPTNGGTTPTYQWKRNGNNVGSNTSTYTTTDINNGDIFTVQLTSNATCANPVTANSNSITMIVTTSVTPSVSISASSTNICSGTSVTLTATPTNGGTTPIYQWKRNGNNVGSNTSTYTTTSVNNGDIFTVQLTSNATCASPVTANSNAITMTVTTNVTPSVSISASSITICSGGSVTFTATPTNGGTTPIYQWKRNGNNVGSNTSTYTTTSVNNGDIFTVQLTSNATCASPVTANSNAITMTVTTNVTPSVSISASSITICSGGSVTFTATPTNGGTTPTYQWKRNGNNVGNNTSTYTTTSINNGDIYTVQLTSNASCASPTTVNSNAITMSVNPLPSASITRSSDTLKVTAGFSSYVWKIIGVVITGATSNIYKATIYGVYEVEVIDVNGCKAIVSYNYINTNVNDPEKVKLASIFPNPTQGNVTLVFEERGARNIQLIDNIGRIVFQTQITQQKEDIQLPELASGLYQIKITENASFVVKPLLITK
jgi:hypothetical protein